ncbi:protein MIS12 homolog [Macrosteles quadrilineatus]|uniref:protein MIS12 homolog n=1 Tax=Macrosteles quadrilineatus TaxID=74068 RepID=UPI0023E287FF|nr:protein MIS12 homolog [Macrosteles quadrilineatus]
MVDIENIRESEYDSQLFGFTVEHFIHAFKMLVHEEVERLTSAMASSLKKKCPEDDIAERALIEGIKNNLVKQYMNNAESSLGMLKAQLRELLHIPPHVLLPEDETQRIQYTSEEEKEMDNLLEDLFQRLKRAKAFKVELLQEMKMLQDVLPDLNRRVEELETLAATHQKKEEDLRSLVPTLGEVINKTQTISQLGNDFINFL